MNTFFFSSFVFFVFLSFFVFGQTCEEGARQPCGSSNKGECTLGMQICNWGQWGVCLGSVEPVPEVCGDEKDNDCDEAIDEQCDCIAGEARICGERDEGICTYGQEFCVNGTWSGVCLNETKPKLNDICFNQFDDDCDGQVDEGCTPSTAGNTSAQTLCFNGIQDAGENGVDCGGSCRSCMSCHDGILNQGELKTAVDLGGGNISDCGGSLCPVCPNCFDGKKNQGEEDIDCGGPCRSCAAAQEAEDIDRDGLTASVELQQGTDPLVADTDGDGVLDKQDRLPLCPNTLCDEGYGETARNCPEDCQQQRSFFWIFVFAFLFFGFIFYLFFTFRHGKKQPLKKTPSAQQKEQSLLPSYSVKFSSSRKSTVEKELDKSLEKADKFFQK